MRKYIIYIFLILVSSSCAQKKAEDTIRLIPEGFTGPVLIIFNQENGEPKEYEGEKRIYRIPESGILKTQFGPNYGIQNHKFFYLNKNNRTEIPFVVINEKDSIENLNKEKIYAYREQALGEVRNFDPKNHELLSIKQPARSFFIGNLLSTEKSAMRQTNFIFKNHK